jgi:hypothetical protein
VALRAVFTRLSVLSFLGLPMLAPGLKAKMHSAALRRVGRRRAAERRFLRPLIEPDVRISRIKCARTHLMRYVTAKVMWRPTFNLTVINVTRAVDTT